MRQSFPGHFRSYGPLLSLSLLLLIPISSHAQVNFSGFATMAGGVATDDNSTFGDYGEKYNFKTDSPLSLQATSDLGNGVGVTAQIIARGNDDWETAFEWAYIRYDATDNWRLLLGRQRTPANFYSDYVDVGYSYHWLTPPGNLYRFSFDSYDAIGSMYNFSWGESDNLLHIMLGRSDDNPFGAVVTSIDSSDYGIVALTTNWRNWTFRAAATTSELTVALPRFDDTLIAAWRGLGATPLAATGIDFDGIADSISAVEDDTDSISFGFKIDFANSFIVAEWEDSDLGANFIGESEKWYVSVGLMRNNWTYHFTYGAEKATVNLNQFDQAEGLGLDLLIIGTKFAMNSSVRDEDFYIVGARWDFHDSAALFIEYTDFSDDYLNPFDPGDSSEDNALFRIGLSLVF